MNPVSRTSRYWSVSELAAHLCVPIYDRTRTAGPDLIPHLKLGKYIRFDPTSDAFQAWLDGKTVAVDTELDL